MKDWRLTRAERNPLIAKAQELGLAPSDFRWSEVDKYPSHYVEFSHLPTGYAFRFDTFSSQGRLRFASDWSPIINGQSTFTWDSRAEQLKFAERWLEVVKIEHETPDLWSTVAQEAELLVGDLADDDRPFTGAERQALRKQLQEVETFIVTTQQLNAQQAAWVHLRFQFVAESAERLTRRDWKLQFLGVVTQVIVGLTMQPALIHELFGFVARHVGPLLGTIQGLLP